MIPSLSDTGFAAPLKPTVVVGGLDIETTGLDYREGHKIIELCLDLWKWRGGTDRERVATKTWRFDPERAIDAKAQKVHGISLDQLKGAPLFKTVAPTLARIINGCHVLVAHNGDSFDFGFLAHELDAAGVPPPNDAILFDTMLKGRWSTPNGRAPKLADLCFATNVRYDVSELHSADRDTKAMMDAFWVGIDLGAFSVPGLWETQEAA